MNILTRIFRGKRRTVNRQLLHAARDGGLARVEQALQNGANLEATDYFGNTPLHLACMHGELDVAQYLLTSHGANLEATNSSGCTPLHWACLNGHVDVVQELVARGADLFVTAANADAAFNLACRFYRNNIIDYLLHAYADKVSTGEGLQAIHSILQAATFSYVAAYPPALSLQVQLPLGNLTLDQFQTLLQLFPANFFVVQTMTGQLPLHIACRVGAPVEILRLFVQAYAAALQTTDNSGGLPLHAACQADAPSLESIRYVVEKDPNAVQAANNDGALPLHLLCGSRPSVQTVQYLLGSFEGALAMRTHQGDLPVMVACKTSSSESVIQILLTMYPDALIYMQEYYNSRR